MQFVHIVGRKNHGKTTLLIELVGVLIQRGLRVGTIKHTSHEHELDKPGSDSQRHRLAGADPAAIFSHGLSAVFLAGSPADDCYARLAPHYEGCDIVLVEGDLDRDAIKIEVHRAALGTSAVASERQDIVLVVSDDAPAVDVPIVARQDLTELADYIVGLLEA